MDIGEILTNMGLCLSKRFGRNTSIPIPVEQNTNTNTNYAPPRSAQTPCHVDGVTTLAFDPKQRCLMSGGNDCQIVISRLNKNNTPERITTLVKHSKPVAKLAFSSQTNLMASGSRDKSICLWNRLWQPISWLEDSHEMVVSGLAFSPDGTKLASGSRDNDVKLWDVSRASPVAIATQHINRNLVTHIHWASQSHVFAQTSEDKELRIWDSRSMEVATSFVRKQNIQTCCDLTPDGLYCLTSSHGFSSSGCELTLWDSRVTNRPVKEFYGHSESVQSCAFLNATLSGSEYDFLFASASNSSQLFVWHDTNSNQTPNAGPVACTTLNGASALLSLACWEEENGNFGIAVGSFKDGIHIYNFDRKRSNFVSCFSF